MMQHLRALVRNERGPTAIEYALVAILVSIALIVGAGLIGTSLNNIFNYAGNQVNR